MSILLAVAVLALIAFTVSIVYAVRALVSYRINPSGADGERLGTEAVWASLEAFEKRTLAEFAELKLAVDEGIRRVDRAENRIQKTVTSARRLVRENGLEHAGIEAEYSELQSGDDEVVQPLPPLPARVAGTRTVRIPGGRLEIGAA